MKNSPFKLTYYLGLFTFSIPIFFILVVVISTITYKHTNKSYEETKPLIKTKIEKHVVYDTVYVDRPKQKIPPKIVTEVKKIDTNIIKDSL
jgi:hypothetical protein